MSSSKILKVDFSPKLIFLTVIFKLKYARNPYQSLSNLEVWACMQKFSGVEDLKTWYLNTTTIHCIEPYILTVVVLLVETKHFTLLYQRTKKHLSCERIL